MVDHRTKGKVVDKYDPDKAAEKSFQTEHIRTYVHTRTYTTSNCTGKVVDKYDPDKAGEKSFQTEHKRTYVHTYTYVQYIELHSTHMQVSMCNTGSRTCTYVHTPYKHTYVRKYVCAYVHTYVHITYTFHQVSLCI